MAEITRNPFEDLGRPMLQLKRAGTGNPDGQAAAARQTLGGAIAGELRTHNRRPIGQDRREREAVFAQHRPAGQPRGIGQPPQAEAAGYGWILGASCHDGFASRAMDSILVRGGGKTMAVAKLDGSPAARLLAWFDRHRRRLPWRAEPGEAADPYRVWLSEIMLQQTTVPTVAERYERFVARFPTVERLADAPLDDVLHAWQGLGYYARARNLHRAAGEIVRRHGGVLPRDEAALRALPGIGDYTVAALRAIAFDQPANVVDGNVERVVARLFAIEAPLPGAKIEIRQRAATLVPSLRAGDYAQALMDLGAMVCTPRSPGCLACPLAELCVARQRGIAVELPRRAIAKAKPKRYAVVYWLERDDGAVLLRRRPENGLLGGMIEIPSGPWRDAAEEPDESAGAAPARVQWRRLEGVVAHGFTHFDIDLVVLKGRVTAARAPEGLWSHPKDFHRLAMPTMTKKVVEHVLGRGWRRAKARDQATRRAVSG